MTPLSSPHITNKQLCHTNSQTNTGTCEGLIGLFLCELFHNQSQLVAQLQATNNDLQTQMLDAPDDIANVASQAASAITQMILTNV